MLTPDVRAELVARKAEILAFLRKDDAIPSAPPPLLRVSRDADLPLSFAQERIWFLSEWEPDSPAYNITVALRASGRLNDAALEQSVNEVVRRHEVLRTTCRNVGGRAVLAIAPSLTLTVPIIDLRGLQGSARETEFLRLAREEAQEAFDLARGPLLRVTVLRLGEEEYGLLVTTHHVVADGWSVRVLFKEIGALYEAFCAGGPSPLSELPIQYADFAHWQREWIQSGVLETQLPYWKKQLEGAPATTELLTDRARPPEQSYRGATRTFAVPVALHEAIRELCRQEGVTPFMALLAAFQTVLHRYTHQNDIVVGTAVSARNRIELEGMIGTFANNLVLRTDFSGNPSFRELLGRVRDVTLSAYAHQDVPFEKLIDELQPQRDLSRTPLFQVLFLLHQTAPVHNLELPGLTLRPVAVDTGTSKFDLSLSLIEGADGLNGEIEYSTDLFDADTITRMVEHFRMLLEGAVADPDQRIDAFPMLTGAERRQLLEEWNATEAGYPRDLCVHELFEAQAKRSPDAVAVVFEQRQLSYGELNARANQLAHYLKARGVGPEVLVGICVERSLDMVVGLLGILKAGGAYIPLDPAYPKERLAFILEETQAPVLLTQQQLLDGLPEHHAQVVCLDRDWEAVAPEKEEDPVGDVAPENLAYVIYTSGSTGRPKGVQINHRSLTNFLNAMSREPGITNEDVLLAVTTVSFDIAALELFLPICVGARAVVVSREVAADGLRLSEELASSGATVMQATPATWRLLIEAGWPGNEGLKILCGGEALPRELADQLLERGGSLWNLYGPTETAIWSTIHRVESREGPVPIGRPIANTQVYVLDAQQQPVPVGVPGELYIGGAGVARGYLNRPEQTAERFVVNPFTNAPAANLYRTGDWVRYQPDGNLNYLWRIDNQVKIRGFRIELAEIETALESHPPVAEAVAAVREYGPGDVRLIAYFVPAPGHNEPTGTELRTLLRAKLPQYMVPSVYVALEALPLTPNGKIDRKALPEPDLFHVHRSADSEPPSTETEIALAEIWKAALGIEGVGANDNFFDLGGHSLLSMQVIFRVEEKLGARLTPRDIVLNTLGQLAVQCDRYCAGRPERGPSRLRRRLWGFVAPALPGNK